MIRKVLIDVDGVIRDYMGYVYQLYSKHFPDHKIESVKTWSMAEYFPIGEDIYDFVFNRHAEEITANAEPFLGAIESIRAHMDEFDIAIVSAQNEKGTHGTLAWMAKHKVPVREYHFTFEKDKIPGDILLDDAPHNLDAFLATGRPAVAIKQPWNDGWKGDKVDNVAGFFDYVKRLNEKEN